MQCQLVVDQPIDIELPSLRPAFLVVTQVFDPRAHQLELGILGFRDALPDKISPYLHVLAFYLGNLCAHAVKSANDLRVCQANDSPSLEVIIQEYAAADPSAVRSKRKSLGGQLRSRTLKDPCDLRANQANRAPGLCVAENDLAVDDGAVSEDSFIQRRIEKIDSSGFRRCELDLFLKRAAAKIERRANMTSFQIELSRDGRGIYSQSFGVDVRGGLRVGGEPAQKLRANFGPRSILLGVRQLLGTGRVMQNPQLRLIWIGVEAVMRKLN